MYWVAKSVAASLFQPELFNSTGRRPRSVSGVWLNAVALDSKKKSWSIAPQVDIFFP